ncbi:hypothetical protein [Streptomyces sp. NPDC016626]|uniref:hypothetical protein n=1 Tax=Streptomyces sp. NPDC016626 TaxID=3364968 RepID=UPI0036FD898B
MPRTDPRLTIITKAIEHLIPGAAPASLSVEVAETLPGTGEHRHSWTGRPAALAERVFTELYGRPNATEQQSPLERAETAKRRRDIVDEIDTLMTGHYQLTAAPWYPSRPGDLVHLAYEPAGNMAASSETYLVSDAGDGLMSLRLLSQTFPGLSDEEAAAMSGVFAAEAADDPLYELWFEAGPHRLTIVRDGQVVHDGPARGRGQAATRILFEAERHAATMHEVRRFLERGEPELALARLTSGHPLPPCGAPGFTPEQADCARPRGHRPPCSDSADYLEPPHECPALPEELYAVLSVGPTRTTLSFEGLYGDKDAALDAASGWGQHTEAEVRGGPGAPDYVFVDLPAPGEPSLAVVAPMPLRPDPRAEEEYAAEGMDYADDLRDVDE